MNDCIYISASALLVLAAPGERRSGALALIQDQLHAGLALATSTLSWHRAQEAFLASGAEAAAWRGFYALAAGLMREVWSYDARDLRRAADLSQDFQMPAGRAAEAAIALERGARALVAGESGFERAPGLVVFGV
jgi:hypothetical protein